MKFMIQIRSRVTATPKHKLAGSYMLTLLV
jgi:hypothetical protein